MPPLQGSNISVSGSAKLDNFIVSFFFFICNTYWKRKQGMLQLGLKKKSTLHMILLRDCTLELLYLNDFNMPPIVTCRRFYVEKIQKINLMLILPHRCKRRGSNYLAGGVLKLCFVSLTHDVSHLENACRKNNFLWRWWWMSVGEMKEKTLPGVRIEPVFIVLWSRCLFGEGGIDTQN